MLISLEKEGHITYYALWMTQTLGCSYRESAHSIYIWSLPFYLLTFFVADHLFVNIWQNFRKKFL